MALTMILPHAHNMYLTYVIKLIAQTKKPYLKRIKNRLRKWAYRCVAFEPQVLFDLQSMALPITFPLTFALKKVFFFLSRGSVIPLCII